MVAMSRAPEQEPRHPQRKRLLHDHADDGAIRRADQLQHGDVAQLLHGHGVDDEGDDDRGHQQQDAGEHADLPPGAIDQRFGEDAFLLGLRERRQMLPTARRLGDRVQVGVGSDARHHRVDRVPAGALRSSRDLDTGRRRGEFELKLLGIQQRDEGDGVAAGGDLIFGKSNNREGGPAELHAVAQLQSGAPVGHHLEMALGNRAPGSNPNRDLPVDSARSR